MTQLKEDLGQSLWTDFHISTTFDNINSVVEVFDSSVNRYEYITVLTLQLNNSIDYWVNFERYLKQLFFNHTVVSCNKDGCVSNCVSKIKCS